MQLSDGAKALLKRMTDEERHNAAKHALDEYNAAYEQGGELDYPMWAAEILKHH